MREWFKKTSGYWTFGIFLLALLGGMGGLGHWGLNAQDAKQDAKIEKASAVAESELNRVEGQTGSEVKRLDGRVDTNLELIKQISVKLNGMDRKLDTLLIRVSASPVKQ